jgi:precorrin-6Y C5,15-methyltransferase (decarboxylating)
MSASSGSDHPVKGAPTSPPAVGGPPVSTVSQIGGGRMALSTASDQAFQRDRAGQGRVAVSVAGMGPEPLGAVARERLATAALVAGGRRQLAMAPLPAGCRTVVLEGDLAPALDAVAASGGPVVVLASGDPGFFGIVRVLAARFGRDRLEVLPSVSAVAAAFAAAGLPWDDALVVSAHGRDPRTAVNACRAHPKVAVLTAPGFGPAELAAALRHAGLGRRLLVAERLGEPDARIVQGDPTTIAAASGGFADPNVVLVLDQDRVVAAHKAHAWPARQVPAGWALPEDAFEHRAGMITKADVRALALARLGPGLGDLVWDVGAGSGAVAVECARFGAGVVAVERDPAACALIAANASRHGVAVQIVEAAAPAALDALPDPDAVFVGGSGGTRSLEAIVTAAASRVRRAAVVALASIERVAPTANALAAAGLAVDTVLAQTAALRPLGPTPETQLEGEPADAHRLVPANPVFLVTGTVTAGGSGTAAGNRQWEAVLRP